MIATDRQLILSLLSLSLSHPLANISHLFSAGHDVLAKSIHHFVYLDLQSS